MVGGILELSSFMVLQPVRLPAIRQAQGLLYKPQMGTQFRQVGEVFIGLGKSAWCGLQC